jgi:hypothetical protein
MDEIEGRFRHPFTMIVGGATGSGKTQWILRFLAHLPRMVSPQIEDILYCYGEYNRAILELEKQGVATHAGVPSKELIFSRRRPLLLVLDDLATDLRSDFLNLLFTRGSHNWSVSVVLVCQNLYTKELRVPRSNSHYIVLLRSPSSQLSVRVLGSQLFPNQMRYFIASYKKATEGNFSYLCIDLHPRSPEIFRLTTNIFPNEYRIAYVPE